ncbi:PPR36 phosphatase, partial [Columbina picui]|nr:PPR36 phosphatase [Columbina picui]
SIFQDDCSATLPEKKLSDREEKLYMLSKWEPHEYVTLDDVKYAALLLNQANKSHLMLSFAEVMRNEKLDKFLMALLLYLSFYLGKIAMEKKCRSLTSTMVIGGNKEMEDVLKQLAVSRIHLAEVYCNFVLRRGMAQHQHTPGTKRKTSWKKDQTFFEGFYNFSSYVAWLVFRRKHFQLIREEISRLLFSDMFNPALKDKNDVDLQKVGDQTAAAKTKQLTSSRKVRAKHHHSISSMINECSPMLRMVLPLPKDGAQHLFQKQDSWDKEPPPGTYDDPSDFSELFNTK